MAHSATRFSTLRISLSRRRAPAGFIYKKKRVSLDALHILVMDEADRMLDMGFSDAIDEVIRFAPATRQTLLFSATWPEAIAAISGRVQQQPIRIEIDTVDAATGYRTTVLRNVCA
ncbi:ATP-dependent RNA helicase [Salmonella enterica subsp. enterica]|uniref:ATP-dependent RNA helicase n=1 Tax=Salmonella enterica I TaxID=59201 RepID=A0A379WT18_SALET|nr:ATP-dependent RNA helicase [Salmonella enterica subsp. enterica]